MLQIKRMYEGFAGGNGYRVLVDRLWPRGISKEKAHINLWAKDVAPSNEPEFHAHKDTFELFRASCRDGLRGSPALPGFARDIAKRLEQGNMAFVTAAKDTHVEIPAETVDAKQAPPRCLAPFPSASRVPAWPWRRGYQISAHGASRSWLSFYLCYAEKSRARSNR